MRRKCLLVSAVAFGLVLAGLAWQASTTGAQNPENGNGKKVVEGPLPIRQVILFNSGVGYFQREGEVEGNAQVELAFPTSDINDLLKSMILQDLGGGRISTVSYDSHDPIEKILRSFALDLNGNPTFGQILNQARGEKIELLLRSDKKDGQAAKIQGTIVGMEVKRRPVGKDAAQVVDMDTLNISGPAGLQGINMEEVLGVRFLNPTLDSEFQRALRVLASSHDTQKKTVNLGFTGVGKRAVRVGYVVERPIWKTSYRLRIEPGGKIFMQGWAMVENTSDDDWNNVRMALVSGRPISYEMNLYEPIYIPRPFVEPEMFASLRPPVYSGAMVTEEGVVQPRAGGRFNPSAVAAPFAGPVGGGIGGFAGGTPPTPISQGGPADIGNGFGGGFAGFGGGFAGGQVSRGFQGGMQGGGMQGGFGGFQGSSAPNVNPYQGNMRNPASDYQLAQNKLSYEEFQRRRQGEAHAKAEAGKKGPAVAGLNFKEGIASVASAEEVGDYYQYIIDQKITLSRQKSALLPILDQTIDGAKVSIFNEETHAKYPLLGLRLKNTSGQPLTQGPITVYDNSTYAGDTRILDLQPNEERLLSYALDVGTEVKTEVKSSISPEMHIRLGEPNLTAHYTQRYTKTYTVKNRSTHERTVILEHPINQDWKLVNLKPSEKTRSHYRFNVKVASGKTTTLEVVEEQAQVDQVALLGSPHPHYMMTLGIDIKPMIQAQEQKLLALKIDKGFLIPTVRVRESRSYHIQNHSDQDRTFTIDHVIRKDWARMDPQGEPQRGPAVFSTKLTVLQGKTGTQEIVEESVTTAKVLEFGEVPEKTLREYVAHAAPSAEVKAALNKALSLDAQWVAARKQILELEASLKTVSTDQARLRGNLGIIPQSAEAYKRFLDKFVAQETEIETLQREVRRTQANVRAAESAYRAFVATMNAE